VGRGSPLPYYYEEVKFPLEYFDTFIYLKNRRKEGIIDIMTIVIGLIDNGIVYMGSDRAMSDEYSISSPITPKIKKNGQFLIGYSSSRGSGQVAHYIDFPNVLKKDVDKYMRTDFIFTLKKAIDQYGIDISDDDKAAADFLVGVHGKLFQISTNDWQVNEYDNYIAIGSGANFAIGSLDTSYKLKDPIKKIKIALDVAIKNSPQCDYPIDILQS
jgi:ATP-dependent protease HslVU (ClpYQ) peptidase subunit